MLFPKELLPSSLPHLHAFQGRGCSVAFLGGCWWDLADRSPDPQGCFQLSALDKREAKREVDRRFI